jgi:aspartyl/asparaginyl beta-hydroxylase (cupin superfamily)
MDIGDRQGFLDEVVRWETRWNMVDGQKPETLLETLNVTNQDFTLMITMPVSSASSERSFSAVRRVKKRS